MQLFSDDLFIARLALLTEVFEKLNELTAIAQWLSVRLSSSQLEGWLLDPQLLMTAEGAEKSRQCHNCFLQ